MSAKKYVFNVASNETSCVQIPAEEIEAQAAAAEAAEAEYWRTADYGEAINAKIRERYTESEEFALLRQQDEKPEEYAVYYAYCEECKAYVKAKMGIDT